MKKMIKKNKNNIILYLHILLQIVLVMTTIYFAQNISKTNFYVFALIIMSLGNAMNYYLFLANRRSKFIEQGSFISIISCFYIFTNILILSRLSNWDINIVYCFLFMIIIVFYTKLYTENLVFLNKYYKLIVVYTLFLYVSKLFSLNIFITIYQGTYFFIGIFPIYIITKNKEKLKKFGKYSYKCLFIMVLIFLAIIISQYFIPIVDFSATNIDVYMTLFFLELIKLFLEFSYLKKINHLHLNECSRWYIIFWFMLLNIISFVLTKDVLMTLIFSTEIVLLFVMTNKLRVVENNKDSINLSTAYFNLNEIIDKQEDLYNERIISFLHDEILQYIIVSLRQVKEENIIENRKNIINLLQETINKIRGEINLYKPKIKGGEYLCDTYITLIDELKDRFKNDEILIDFNCYKSLDLVEPYASVIYKCIHEIVINIFKHSKGFYSEINLHQSEDKIFLTSVNYGDYMDIEANKNIKNVGLRILELEVKKLGGKIDIKMNPNNFLEEGESSVSIGIEIPMKREVIYEDFINRRS
ncbi:hypothetical protein FYJ71_02010 [Peptostreptococcus anaerobius]|uniref:Uncharacterized protein n=1 Tax=Peptostreptococcus porci TaxID=2652282 RepID=A0A6N7WY84_9FIRM|nr:hypothetical protein [Peptostreptococcus porci]MST61748.1 hypothetical protein [Peptostreptococcus porci]